MAVATTTTKLLLQLGDGASPETFAANCSINTNREFTLEASPLEFAVPDCADEDAPSWMTRVVDTLSAGITGSGTLDTPSLDDWRIWFLSGDPKNVRVKLDVSSANGGGYFQGAFVLTSLGLSKEGKGLAQISVAMQSSGAISWTAAS